MDRIFRAIAYHPWRVLAAVAVASAVSAVSLYDFASGRLRLGVDVSTNRLLPEHDEEKRYYEFVRRAFGSDETMLVALHAPDVFTHSHLSRIARLTERIRAVDGVREVLSLTNALNIRGTEDGLDLRPFVSEVPRDPAELARIRREALENPIYAGNLVSRDGRTAALLIYFLNFSDRDFIDRGIDDAIQRIAEEEAGDAEIWLAGGPHFKVAQIGYQLRGLSWNLPLIVAALGVVLVFTFRTVRGVLLPLVTILVALLWTMGITARIYPSLNLVTILVPQLMLVLSLSYSVHVVTEYYDHLREDPHATGPDAVFRSLRMVWLPVALTAFTTVAGFVSLLASPMSAIREFGLLQVIGILVTLVAALVLTPALLAILGRPRRRPVSSQPGEEDWFGNLAAKAAEFDLAHRRAIFVAAGITFALACLAATRLEVGSDSIKSFPPHSDLRRDFEAVNEHLEGASQFNVVFESREPGTFLEPVNLREIESFQEWLKEQPEIGGTTSVVDYLKLINRSFHDNEPAYLAIPENGDVAARLLFLGANEELESFVDRGHRMANVLVRARVLDTAPIAALVERIEERLDALPGHLEARVTGNLILVNRLVDDLVRSQAYSLLSGTLLIYGICWLWFLSRRTALVAMIPNVLPIAVYFGVLGITGITLNPATSVVAPMTLGVAIDDTIHYFARFNSDAKRFANERRATVTALRSVGRPVTYTTIALCVGFLVLTTSELRAWVELGALGAFTLGFAWLVDLFLTPALCGGLRVVTLWDTLTLDLGEEPQRSIPIFKGLSNTQCRIVALMASLRSIPAGHRLMSAGEQGREMYVVIDGKLRIWKEGDSGPIVLNTCSRGDVVGEVGFLYKTRSAHADVVEDARLLRLTPTNMERLARRYPRIAARVFRGLGEVVAERLWQTTSRLQ